jgi:predicted nucleotidyltransferase
MISNTGLDDRTIHLINTVFENYPEVSQVVIFGSRAKGTYSPNSDIDLAIFGVSDELSIGHMAVELNELPLPYKFDAKAFGSIRNIALRVHIERVGVKIYPDK